MFNLSCYSQYSMHVPRGAIFVCVWSVIKAISDHTQLLLEELLSQKHEYKFPYYKFALLY